MDLFQHVRSVISILVGFSLTRLLSTAPQLAQRERKRVYWVHLVWCLFVFLYTIGFWWWEFQLITVPRWTFPLYVFVAVYGAVVYFLCALLSPNDLSHYEGYKEYFFSRRKWFFGAISSKSGRYPGAGGSLHPCL
jgi:apolipoprotein N-acyltransferase